MSLGCPQRSSEYRKRGESLAAAENAFSKEPKRRRRNGHCKTKTRTAWWQNKLKHFLKKWAISGPFLFIFIFSNKIFCNKYVWKIAIQYTVLGFEPTTFRTWVSSHNHKTIKTLFTVWKQSQPLFLIRAGLFIVLFWLFHTTLQPLFSCFFTFALSVVRSFTNWSNGYRF